MYVSQVPSDEDVPFNSNEEDYAVLALGGCESLSCLDTSSIDNPKATSQNPHDYVEGC